MVNGIIIWILIVGMLHIGSSILIKVDGLRALGFALLMALMFVYIALGIGWLRAVSNECVMGQYYKWTISYPLKVISLQKPECEPCRCSE